MLDNKTITKKYTVSMHAPCNCLHMQIKLLSKLSDKIVIFFQIPCSIVVIDRWMAIVKFH